MLSRRRFVITAAGLTAASSAGVSWSTKAAPAAGRQDVLVLGAGLSGLTAAMILKEQGARVTLLEARNRVGGRVYTRDDVPGRPEAGANSFFSGYGHALDMLRRLKVPIYDCAPRFAQRKFDYYLRDQYIRPAEWAGSAINPFPAAWRTVTPERLLGQLAGEKDPLASYADWCAPQAAAFDESAYAFLDRLGCSPEAIRLAADVNPGYGSDAFLVSMMNWYFVSGWTKVQLQMGKSQWAVTGGNSRLPEAMAEQLGESIHRGKTVVAIDTGAARPQVRCADGALYTADHVICALPLPPLRSIAFDRPLSVKKRKAIASVPVMRITETYLAPTAPFWEVDGRAVEMWTDTPVGMVIADRLGDTDNGITSISCWGRGFLADELDMIGPDAAKARVLDEYVKLRPAAKGKVEVSGFHSWQADPFAGGDWVVWAPGQPAELAKAVGEPEGRLHFCGEHTALTNRGMEGAMESGERAAFEIL